MNNKLVRKITALTLAVGLIVATAVPAAAGGKTTTGTTTYDKKTGCTKTVLANGYVQISCDDGGWD